MQQTINKYAAKALYTCMLAILVIQTSMLSSCYHNTRRSKTKTVATAQPDTAAFERTHHYSLNYNFVVKADSLVLLRQQPEELLNGMQTDSVSVYKHDHIVVADISSTQRPNITVHINILRYPPSHLSYRHQHNIRGISYAHPTAPQC